MQIPCTLIQETFVRLLLACVSWLCAILTENVTADVLLDFHMVSVSRVSLVVGTYVSTAHKY